MKGRADMAGVRRVDSRGGTLRRRVGRPLLIASALFLTMTHSTPASRPIRAECVSVGCRLYLPHVGGRHRLDISEYGPEGLRWRYHGQTDRILDMAYDARGHLWTATLGGLVEWPPAPADPIRHSLQAIRLVAVDASGAVWYGGEAGRAGEVLHRRSPDGRLRTVIPADGLPGGSLVDLVADRVGQVFAAWRVGDVGGGGLSRIDASGAVRTWRQADGLKHRDVTLLASDGAGGVWFGQVDEEGQPMPGLGLLSRSGSLRPDVAMPAEVKELPVVGLEPGADGGILVIFRVEDQARLAAATGSSSRRDGGGMGATALFERMASGVWTALELPVEAADAQRLLPLGFDQGPRRATVDANGTLWVVLEGIAMAMSPSGRLTFRPSRLAADDPSLARELWSRLGAETALASRPGGGMAVAAWEAPGWMTVEAAPGSALSLLADPAALPVEPDVLAAGPAGSLYLSGGRWDRRGVWQRSDRSGGWQRLGGSPPAMASNDDPGLRTTIGPVHITPDGVYWIADGRDLLRVTPDRRQRTVVRPADGLTGGGILCFATGADGTLWVGTTKGLLQLDSGGRWLRHDLPGGMPPRSIADLAVAADGNLWLALPAEVIDEVALEGGVVRLRPGLGSEFWSSGSIYEIPDGFGLGQNSVAVAADGSVWTGGDAGIARGDSAGLWRPMNHEAGLELFETVGDLEIDARGLVWVASWQGGVLRYEPTRDRWTDYFSDQTVNGQVSAMAADAGGSVWFGVTDAEDGAATLVRRDPSGRWQAVNMQAVARGIEDARVQSLALTPDGSVVQTTFNDYLLLYGAAGVGKWMPQDRLPPTSGPLPLCSDRDGRLWTLPFSGLASHREPSGWRIEQTAEGLPYPAFSSIACAADGSLWLGNPPLNFDQQRQGLAASGVVRRLPDGRWQDLRQELGLGIEGVGAMASSPDGTLALATIRSWMPGDTTGPTIGTGLLIRHADGRLRRFDMEQLRVADLRALLYDPQGLLWLATDRGVLRLSPGGEVTVLSSVGLPSLDLRNLAWARGRLWAATAAGAAERLPDGRWRPYGRDDGLADEALRGVVAGPQEAIWFLDHSGGISVLLP